MDKRTAAAIERHTQRLEHARQSLDRSTAEDRAYWVGEVAQIEERLRQLRDRAEQEDWVAAHPVVGRRVHVGPHAYGTSVIDCEGVVVYEDASVVTIELDHPYCADTGHRRIQLPQHTGSEAIVSWRLVD